MLFIQNYLHNESNRFYSCLAISYKIETFFIDKETDYINKQQIRVDVSFALAPYNDQQQ